MAINFWYYNYFVHYNLWKRSNDQTKKNPENMGTVWHQEKYQLTWLTKFKVKIYIHIYDFDQWQLISFGRMLLALKSDVTKFKLYRWAKINLHFKLKFNSLEIILFLWYLKSWSNSGWLIKNWIRKNTYKSTASNFCSKSLNVKSAILANFGFLILTK